MISNSDLSARPTRYATPDKPTFHSIGSINTYIQHLSSCFEIARKAHHLSVNPFKGKKERTADGLDSLPTVLTDKELRTVRDLLKEDRPSWWRLAIELALRAGLRRSEVLDANKNKISYKEVNGTERWFIDIRGKGRAGGKVRTVSPIGRLERNHRLPLD